MENRGISIFERESYEAQLTLDEETRKIVANYCRDLLVFDGCTIKNPNVPGAALEGIKIIAARIQECVINSQRSSL